MQKVVQYIERHKLFSPDDKILVALSGGADSVALLRLLLSLGYTCEAAHCNFHLRGAESDRDEHFVRQLCLEHRVTLHTVHFNTEQEAKERHISIEMAARELRYAWFEKTREACSAAVIAVAHHQDDSVETLLLNLIRGTGINGLRGIRPRNGHIVRPLLCLDRKEIVGYLESIGQAYVTDSTNLQDEYTRNKIRLNLLPMMQEINPSVKESILKTAEHLDDAASIYNIGIEEAKLRVKTPEGIWALVVPGALPVYNTILLMNFFRNLPKEIKESAILDGISPVQMMLRICVPLALPAIATVTVFSIVGHWNNFFDGLLLTNTPSKMPLQTYIQTLTNKNIDVSSSSLTPEELEVLTSLKTFNAAKIVAASLPIVVFYPFMQRFFVSGLTLGSVKE